MKPTVTRIGDTFILDGKQVELDRIMRCGSETLRKTEQIAASLNVLALLLTSHANNAKAEALGEYAVTGLASMVDILSDSITELNENYYHELAVMSAAA